MKLLAHTWTMRDRELLDLIDVEEFLTELGVQRVRPTGSGEIQFSCPFPGHIKFDTHPSASMSTEERPVPDKPDEFYPRTSFYCFTCGARGTAINFLAEYEGVSIVTAKRFIRERFGNEVSLDEDASIVAEVDAILNPAPRESNRALIVPGEDEIERRKVDWQYAYDLYEQQTELPAPFCYLFDRGFGAETLMHFEVGFDDISSRLSIPVRDEKGVLVGFKGRSWWEGGHPKYLVLGGEKYGFDPYEVSRVLFILEWVIQREHTDIIVREGELNAMMMHQMGFTNTVGLSGKRLSQHQVSLLKSSAESATMYFDDEADAIKAAELLDEYMPVKVVPSSERDPADSTKEEVEELLESSVSSLLVAK
jgi:DNA primase